MEIMSIILLIAVLYIWHLWKSKKFWDRVDGPGPVTNVRVSKSDD